MLLLGLLACGPAAAEEVAAIMVVSGDAMIRRDGALLPAEPGLALHTTDTLVTDEDDAIIVHLSNDHVVRIDSELELPVSGIVMLKAPPSAIEPGDQLASLLYSDERSGIDSTLLDRAERVAGWHSRLTAAEAYTGVTAEPAVEAAGAPPAPPPPPGRGFSDGSNFDATDMDEELEYGGGGLGLDAQPRLEAVPDLSDSLAADAPAAKPRPRPARGGKKDKGRKSSARDTQKADSAQLPADDVPTTGKEAPAPSVTPASLAADFAEQGALRQCVVDWARDLPVPIASVDITVILDADGRIERLAAGGGLFLPECARTAGEDTLLNDSTPNGSGSSPVRFTVELD